MRVPESGSLERLGPHGRRFLVRMRRSAPLAAVRRYHVTGSAFLASRSGSFSTFQVSSKIMASPLAAEYFGQFGSPPPLRLPVLPRRLLWRPLDGTARPRE